MKKLLLFAILLVGLAVISQGSTNAAISDIEANGFCTGPDKQPAGCIKEDKNANSGSVSCTDGNVISSVYVHAGDAQTVYQLPHEGFAYEFSNSGKTVTVEVTTHPHNISWIGIVCGSATPTPTATPTLTPTPTPSATPVVTPSASPYIRVTTMGYCDSEGKNYLRLRNDGSMAVNDAAWKHVNSGLVQSVGSLNPGQFVYFSGPNGQYEGGYIDNGQFVRTHG